MKTSLTITFVLITTFVLAQSPAIQDINLLNNPDNLNEEHNETYTDDRDGHVYEIIKLGEQIWMSQNLNFVSPDSWCYNNKKSYCKEYGRLYTYEAANKVCPAGWHLPNNEEWQTMIVELEKESADKKIETGFNTTSGGFRSESENYYNFKEIGFYWSSTEKIGNCAWYHYIYILSNDFLKNYKNINMAFSVRCKKD